MACEIANLRRINRIPLILNANSKAPHHHQMVDIIFGNYYINWLLSVMYKIMRKKDLVFFKKNILASILYKKKLKV